MYIAPVLSNNINSDCRIYVPKKLSFSGKYITWAQVDEKIKEDDISTVKNLPDIYIINKKSENLLHSSAKYDKKDISKFLLKNKLNPNQKNSHGKTPFAIACSRLNKSHVEAFLPYNIDINTQDNLNNTPLHQAVKSPEIVELLLKNRANPYLKNDFGKTPFALSYNYQKTLETYLKFRVNPNTTDSKSQTLMHEAVKNNNLSTAEILRKYHADTNYKDEKGKSPIFYANTLEVAKWLVDNNAEINLTDKNKQTALHLNVINSNIKMVENLLKLKANPNIKDKNNLTPLAYAKTLNMMKLLLANGANPDIITPNGSSILHNTVKSDNIKGIYYLTEYNANPNILDKERNIPYDYAKSKEAKILLLGAGSNPNYKNYLKDALIDKDFEIFSYLLECGANPNRPDNYGKTSIFYANNDEEIKELKKYNVNLDFYNKCGYTPMHHFALIGDKDTVNLLKENGAVEILSLNGETINDCYKKFETYSSWIKPKSKKQPSFTGNPYNLYGTPGLRKDLNYKTELTKEKIDEIIISALNTEKGIYEAYKMLNREESKIYTAMNSLGPILQHFNIVIKEDIAKIVKKNPSGSKIPLVGYFIQLAKTKLSDEFMNEIEAEAKSIANQYEDIITHYYSLGIKKNIEKYNELNEYLTEGIKYVNYVNGDSENLNKILSNLEQRKLKCAQKHRKYITSINKQSQKYEKLVDKLMNIQEDKQEKRTIKKGIIKILTIGLS